MFALTISTILTSAADSLNPIAITQQFVLQGMVKKPKHIWFFILATGITNLIGGFLAYFGLVNVIGRFFAEIMSNHAQTIFTAELILGIAFLIAVCYLIQNAKIKTLQKQIASTCSSDEEKEREEAVGKIKSVSPAALTVLGIGATISELATALPYFAFLAILFSQPLTFLEVSFLLILYNLIYMSPLMVLYFVYTKAQDKFDALYLLIKKQITRFSHVAAPTLVGLVGVVLVAHSVSLLLA
ncbi:GAP family protein [Scatolibacter rhodanostii]|uniref:GAP family protein n=1 Tax=Scatolibacter rhodanostii TaxID=2014781 RepID=UPI001356413B|nr:GAP family protein [Scatolibacter rhodanostii]